VAPPKRKTRAGKESKSTPSAPSTAEESTEAPLEEPIESTVSPAKKTKVGKESKSTTSVPLAAKESMAAPVGESVEPTVAPSKPKRASPARQAVKKSAASGPSKGQKKASISSSTDEEGPSAAPIPSPPKKKKFTAPLFPLGAAGRTRSKSGPKVSLLLLLCPFFMLHFIFPLCFSHILVCGRWYMVLVDLVEIRLL
jgi:hypothetical protein